MACLSAALRYRAGVPLFFSFRFSAIFALPLFSLFAFPRGSRTFCHSYECWSKLKILTARNQCDGSTLWVVWSGAPISPPLSAISHPPSAEGGLFFAVDLGPDGQHYIAEYKGIQRDEGDVAAEVEGEHAADEEEEHAAGLVPLQVLPG